MKKDRPSTLSNQPLEESEKIQSEEDVLAEEMLELDAEDSQWARPSLVNTARALLARGTKRTTVAGIYGEDIAREAEDGLENSLGDVLGEPQ